MEKTTKKTTGKAAAAIAHTLRQVITVIGNLPFLLLIIVELTMRLFVVFPIGPALALACDVIWLWWNRRKVGWYLQKLYVRFTAWTCGYVKSSLWYENDGRTQILTLVQSLTAQGIFYCNLADKLDLPDKSHWLAISTDLSKQGILTQISGDAFYIAWPAANAAG